MCNPVLAALGFLEFIEVDNKTFRQATCSAVLLVLVRKSPTLLVTDPKYLLLKLEQGQAM